MSENKDIVLHRNSLPSKTPKRTKEPDLVIPPLILGRESEWKTNDQTFGQFWFRYVDQDSVELDAPADPNNRIFLNVPGYKSWVYGEDYGYSQDENSIYFLRKPPRIYAEGGEPGREVRGGDIIWAFFHKLEGSNKDSKK